MLKDTAGSHIFIRLRSRLLRFSYDHNDVGTIAVRYWLTGLKAYDSYYDSYDRSSCEHDLK